jgi:exosortase B
VTGLPLRDGTWCGVRSLHDALSFLLIGAGLLALYVPVYWAAANGIWHSEEHGLAPVVFVMVVWLFWRSRTSLDAQVARPDLAQGGLWLLVGLMCYLMGRVFGIASLEFLSQIPVAAAVLVCLKGRYALRAAWFPLAYLIFMVPVPASLLDAATGPLKHWISMFVVEALYTLGYPVARTGVVITAGPYQLQVADACSGLNSLVSLAALGVLYLHLAGRKSVLQNVVLAASIVPIALVANVVRVMVLVLITFHLGDEAGQGFLHDAAGFVVLMIALGAIFGLDRLLIAFLPAPTSECSQLTRRMP